VSGNDVHVCDSADYAETTIKRSKVSGAELREAMDKGRLSLIFQPIVSLHGQMAEVFQVEVQLEDEYGNIVDHDALMASQLDKSSGCLWIGGFLSNC
jgi:predicted signal transduction protein with EAL and GGDEF domain